MKTEILTILRESEGYVSGQQLCEQMHVSRTAVWKVIEQLKKEGYTIEAVRNKGYRLTGSPDVMSSAEIESLLETAWAGRDVLYLDETDSTNVQAKKLGEAEGKHGTLIVSDRQTAGKGRRGRGWDSPSGASIYMSILLRPDILPDKAPMLTLVMALAVVRAVREITGEEAGIKWPNDIVLNKKKICGILTEMSAEIDYINHVVIGVGINVNTEDFPEEIKKTATSLFIETGKKWKRSEFIAAAMKYFEEYYEIFLKTQNLKMLQEIYNGFLVNKDAQVRVLEPGNEFDGCALGINETGELLVRKSDGEITKIYAGEVSVRGIYGYV
jgi:BirA family biotin operon repressor/biotin-[acetyl-CoA-carboxylase] ligase